MILALVLISICTLLLFFVTWLNISSINDRLPPVPGIINPGVYLKAINDTVNQIERSHGYMDEKINLVLKKLETKKRK